MDWITPQPDKEPDFTPSEHNLTIDDFYCSIETEARKPDKKLLSKKFIDLIGQGYKPGEAAKRVGTSIKGIMSDSKVQKQLEGLIKNYKLGADTRRELARAIVNKLALENMDGDPGQQKLALDAVKVIGADTEVGINAPPQPGIQINVGNLQGLFANIEGPQDEIIQGEIIDVTTEPVRMVELGQTEAQTLDADGIRKLAEGSS